jgi:uncharacterized membrane protein YjfL (UPF0719 family)
MNLDKFAGDVVLSIAWTIIGSILLFLAASAYERLHPLEFRKSIGDGNVAAGIVLAAIIIALGMIIAALVRA